MSTFNCGKGQPYTVGQGIYEESESQKMTLGTRLCLGDGRVFHYSKWGGTVAAGKLATAAAIISGHHSLTAATTAIGSRSITVTLATTAATADCYKDGTLMVIAGTGLGQTYKIKSNPAQTSTTGTLALALYDQLVVALATSDSKVDLFPNLFNGVTQDTTEEALHLGVPLIAGTSGYYGWLQTWGLCSILSGDTASAGTIVSSDDGVGDTKAAADHTKGWHGTIYGAAHADGEYNAVFLQIIP